MKKEKKYTKKEKEIIGLIDRLLIDIEDQRDVWAEILDEYEIDIEELKEFAKNNFAGRTEEK